MKLQTFLQSGIKHENSDLVLPFASFLNPFKAIGGHYDPEKLKKGIVSLLAIAYSAGLAHSPLVCYNST